VARLAPMPGKLWLARGTIAVTWLISVASIPLGLLILADFATAERDHPDPRARIAWALRRGHHLHYAVHLIAGRLLDLCPCTRAAASTQYYRARFHAVTRRQRAVVAPRPSGAPTDWAAYAAGPMAVARDWIGDGVSWLSRSIWFG
jgi:hypothetical protein